MRKRVYAFVIVAVLLGGALLLMLIPNDRYDVYHDVSYGECGERNTMDIYLPEKAEDMNSLVPIFMYIHGGGWTSGNKQDGEGWRGAMRTLGCILVSVNYRFIAPGNIDGTDCDDILDDIGSAIAYLKDNASAYNIDTSGMAIGGDSAGAHISLLYSYSRESPIPIKFVISRSGPSDLTDPSFYESHESTGDPKYDEMAMTPENAASLVTSLIGIRYTAEELSAGAVSGARLDALNGISPIHYVTQDIPKTLFAYGGRDNIVPSSQTGRIANAMSDAGLNEGDAFDIIMFENSWHDLADPRDDDAMKKFMNAMALYFHEELGTELFTM